MVLSCVRAKKWHESIPACGNCCGMTREDIVEERNIEPTNDVKDDVNIFDSPIFKDNLKKF